MKHSVLHSIPFVGPQSFGVGPVALNLCREQNLLGHDSKIWCLDGEENRRWAAQTADLYLANLKSFTPSCPALLNYSLAMEKAVRDLDGKNIHIIHQHGIWSGISRVSNILRHRYETPTIVAPHGSLEKWALQKSWLKKRIALSLYEQVNLEKASCLHACSHQEVACFRDFGLSNPIAVIPNGIGATWLESKGDGSSFRREFKISESTRILLYLSRITPVKRLPMLMEALGSIRENLSDWVLVLAGADEGGHLKKVRQAVTAYGLRDIVLFTGLLNNQIKRDAFAAADLFVLPTLRENFAIVVAEALGASVPVITTKGAPWQDLVNYDCGWWTDISSDALASALLDAVQKPPAELKEMGERGRALVSSRYTWKQAARMTIELYEWLLGLRERPTFVTMN